jgi:alpha-galactosidase
MATFNLSQYAAPGGINDPCMLLSKDNAGAPAMTHAQTQAQFAQWAIMASPLLISGSILHMEPEIMGVYSNAEVIAVNQDPLVKQGNLVFSTPQGTLGNGAAQIWARVLVDGSWAVHFINAGKENLDLLCDAHCFAQIRPIQAGEEVVVRDLYQHKDVQTLTSPSFGVAQLAAEGGSRLFKLTWKKQRVHAATKHPRVVEKIALL